MEKLNIICIDDQREVLATLGKDLEPLETHCEMLSCESAEEAGEVLEELDAAGAAYETAFQASGRPNLRLAWIVGNLYERRGEPARMAARRPTRLPGDDLADRPLGRADRRHARRAGRAR